MKPSATQASLVTIAKPVYGGAFLARVEGKAVFVPHVLPGETARIRIAQQMRGYAMAELEEVVTAAPERRVPNCRHFGACGGCDYQHADYAAQLEMKQAILRETLARAGVEPPAEISVLAADPLHYRNRIRLAFDANGDPGYRSRRSNIVIPISECPIAAPLLLQAAVAFAQEARRISPALQATEIALFTNAEETELQLTVFSTHAKRVPFEALTNALRERIPELTGAKLVLEGRAGTSQRTVANWGEPSILYRAGGFSYRVDHGAFFQVNRWLMDSFMDAVTLGHEGALAWDLYAGVGLFARKLTASFGRVVAVESAPGSTQALAANLKGTRSAPVRATTLDFLRRPMHGPAPDFIVVDPPRAGLGEETTTLLAATGAPALAYVSCDPATLARDLQALIGDGYAIHSMTLADLFPQTFHLETVVQLRRS